MAAQAAVAVASLLVAKKQQRKAASEARGDARDAKKLQRKQTGQIDEQTGREKLRLAEEESLLAKKRAFIGGKSAGRQSLIATSQTGLKSNLGGT